MNINMNTKSVYIFPDTMPKEEIMFPLVQFFEQVVYLRPVENDPPEPETLTPLCREAVAANLINYNCPAPLEEHRERFLHLVRELQARPDEFAAQLSNLSLAGLGQKNSESKTTIISTLLQQKGIKEKQQELRSMVLWQARLVLTLGEFFDRDQAELLNNLEQISQKEKGLLAKLREDKQQPFSFTETLSRRNEKTGKQRSLRLKAWSRLLGLGRKGNITPMTVFVTASRDAFDLLTEQYQTEQNQHPVKIIELELPVTCIEENPVEKIIAFKDEAASLLQSIQKIDPAAASSNNDNIAAFNTNWTTLLEKHYPSSDSSRCLLTLYALPGAAAEKLFLETFGRDETDIQFNTPTPVSDSPETIIGILQ
ncbi:MAG: hypothetical protein DSY70_07680 [Desulfobulbus sp.]|nr:MAG: hypothetical protein DSY70_07680 [Desulfobulbus sp.]